MSSNLLSCGITFDGTIPGAFPGSPIIHPPDLTPGLLPQACCQVLPKSNPIIFSLHNQQHIHTPPHPLPAHPTLPHHAHILLTPKNLNPLPLTQLHQGHHLPHTNSNSKFPTDQSWLNPIQTDLIYAIKHAPGGSKNKLPAILISML